MEPSVWLIGGPTASGKSALALALAGRTGGEIVNADSMQLYADLRVLTARPGGADLARAPHHLYGVADAREAWSVGRWLRAVRPVLAAIATRGRTAIVVGGTGLYFRALTQGLADIPPVAAPVRAEVSALYERIGEGGFRTRLAERDPVAAGRIGQGDRQRLIRAFEVAEASGRPLTDWQAGARALLPPNAYRAAVVEPPRAALYARCDERLQRMLEHGALDEVRTLVGRNLSSDLPAMKALGVAPFARHIAGEIDLPTALTAAQQATRNYVKRQFTWFRNQTPDWLRVTGAEAADALIQPA